MSKHKNKPAKNTRVEPDPVAPAEVEDTLADDGQEDMRSYEMIKEEKAKASIPTVAHSAFPAIRAEYAHGSVKHFDRTTTKTRIAAFGDVVSETEVFFMTQADLDSALS